ncbi:hypothetical protein HYU07_00180 [Candidatus Woesearchaeota archaeon]|nr:hypothetical protein [Candidatus Woesearchaeota archaeon]
MKNKKALEWNAFGGLLITLAILLALLIIVSLLSGKGWELWEGIKKIFGG